MNTLKFALSIVCASMCVASNALGAVTLAFAPTATNLTSAGGTVTFTISADGEIGDNLAAADLFLKTGSSIPVTFSNRVNVVGFDILSNPQLGGSDFGIGGVNLFNPAFNISDPTNLFRFDATFSPNLSASDEVYNFTFDTANINFALTNSLQQTLTVNPSGATITVAATAVPEPSSFALLALAGCGVAVRLRRRFSRHAAAA
jgi:hypothetical protein